MRITWKWCDNIRILSIHNQTYMGKGSRINRNTQTQLFNSRPHESPVLLTPAHAHWNRWNATEGPCVSNCQLEFGWFVWKWNSIIVVANLWDNSMLFQYSIGWLLEQHALGVQIDPDIAGFIPFDAKTTIYNSRLRRSSDSLRFFPDVWMWFGFQRPISAERPTTRLSDCCVCWCLTHRSWPF